MEIKIKSTSAFATIDTVGAEVTSMLDVTGTQYMWQKNEHLNKTSPLLFPYIGDFRDNKTLFNGKIYDIVRNGFAQNMDFKVLMQSEDKVVLSLSSTPETLQVYPFKFMIQVSFQIHDCILDINYKVMNTGEETMYYCIGVHPSFNCPMVEGDETSDYRLVFPQNETVSVPVFDIESKMYDPNNRKTYLDDETTVKLNTLLEDRDVVLLDTLKSREVQFDSMKTGRGIKLVFDGFEQVAVWRKSDEKSKYACIEPWCGSATFTDEGQDFEKKRGVQVLEETESRNHKLTLVML